MSPVERVGRIERDFVAAYKNKAERLVAVLSMLKTAIKNRQVNLQRPLSPLSVDGKAIGKAVSDLARTRLTA